MVARFFQTICTGHVSIARKHNYGIQNAQVWKLEKARISSRPIELASTKQHLLGGAGDDGIVVAHVVVGCRNPLNQIA